MKNTLKQRAAKGAASGSAKDIEDSPEIVENQEVSLVTKAVPEDIAQIMSMGYRAFHENLSLDCPIDYDKSLITITNAVVNGWAFVQRNLNDINKIDGVLVFAPQQPWFSNTVVLTNLLFYVKQDYRTFQLVKNLVQAAKEYAIINKTPIVFDLFTQKDVNKKKKLLTYLGFKEVGSSYIFAPMNT